MNFSGSDWSPRPLGYAVACRELSFDDFPKCDTSAESELQLDNPEASQCSARSLLLVIGDCTYIYIYTIFHTI